MISLRILPDLFTLYQLPRTFKLPMAQVADWPWYTISKTTSELSVLLPAQVNPSWQQEEQGVDGALQVKVEENWRALQVDAQMDFGLVGILTAIISPLRDHGIPVFCISTFDTDYILVKQDRLENALGVLANEPKMVVKSGLSVLDEQ
ncbi:ACT domain-domain-containing protein [Absidia repens]|uniref:ACT domain-domain-containing protein n=1 Tax=Absidia repens TaxID=90262 RepID=A0A1X2IY19_9FUNG|nr:ACT domain-domain-containing protein [Absidia repens]